jgi:hypothetical protein
MKRFSSQEASLSAFRALQTVALANGIFDDAEKALLRLAAWLYQLDPNESLPSIDAEQLAKALQPEDAPIALQDCVLMALVDHEASDEEWRLLRAYASTLHINEDILRTYYDDALSLRTFAQKEQERRQLGLFLQELSTRQGQKGLEAFFRKNGASLESPAISWRYRRLGIYPEQSLGRSLWAYCHLNDFGLPGEVGGVPESWLWHDLLHVLTEYSTDTEGETLLASFTAGMLRRDPFPYVLLTLLPATQKPSLSKIERAYARGLAAQEAFTKDWDPWEDLSLTLLEARAKFGIIPS